MPASAVKLGRTSSPHRAHRCCRFAPVAVTSSRGPGNAVAARLRLALQSPTRTGQAVGLDASRGVTAMDLCALPRESVVVGFAWANPAAWDSGVAAMLPLLSMRVGVPTGPAMRRAGSWLASARPTGSDPLRRRARHVRREPPGMREPAHVDAVTTPRGPLVMSGRGRIKRSLQSRGLRGAGPSIPACTGAVRRAAALHAISTRRR
jgi:hypothetical protein